MVLLQAIVDVVPTGSMETLLGNDGCTFTQDWAFMGIILDSCEHNFL
jgi:hypothetical protein